MRFITNQKIAAEAAKALAATKTYPEAITGDVVELELFYQFIEQDQDAYRTWSREICRLVWEQAEDTVTQMEGFIKQNNIVDIAAQARYLQGSVGGLGFTRMATTLQRIYNLHQPPHLGEGRRTMSFSASESSSSYSSAYSSDNSSSDNSYASSLVTTPELSPDVARAAKYSGGMDFDLHKINRAKEILLEFRKDTKQTKMWIAAFYTEVDRLIENDTRYHNELRLVRMASSIG